MPVLQGNGEVSNNKYSFSRGAGLVDLRLPVGSSQAINNYLRNEQVQIEVSGKFFGQLPLFQLFGSDGNVLAIPLFEGRKTMLSGHFILRLHRLERKEENAKEPPAINEKQNREEQAEQKQEQELVFVWVYVQELVFLNPRQNEGTNIFVQSGKTKSKTVWNNSSPCFKEILVFQLPNIKRPVSLEVWNRNKKDVKIGTADVELPHTVSFNLEVPIRDSQAQTVGYLKCCSGVGDLAVAIGFINSHLQISRSSERPDLKKELKGQSEYGNGIEGIESIEAANGNDGHREQPPDEGEESSHHSLEEESVDKEKGKLPSKPGADLSIEDMHNIFFTEYHSRHQNWLAENHEMPMTQFIHLLRNTFEGDSKSLVKLSAFYLDTASNKVKIGELSESYEAFLVYFLMLVEERDQCVRETLDRMSIDISELEDRLDRTDLRAKPAAMWADIAEVLEDGLLAQKLRLFFEGCDAGRFCDQLRKFEVFETTEREKVPTSSLARKVHSQICEILELHYSSTLPAIEAALIRQEIILSKWERLVLFGLQPRGLILQGKPQQGLIKSPTFGFLHTDRVQRQPAYPQLRMNASDSKNPSQAHHNPSIEFSEPNISPIHRDSTHSGVVLQFSNLDLHPSAVIINGREFDLSRADVREPIKLNIPRDFGYVGVLHAHEQVEFEGVAGEWISLTDEAGNYRGCLILY